jgi:hypothetical protein
MPAPIVIELAHCVAPDPAYAQALVGGCSRATGAGGCILRTAETALADTRVRVVVSFWDGYSRARIEAIEPVSDHRARTRDIAFRDEDPLPERFRAAGLVAAGLVSDMDEAASDSPPYGVESARTGAGVAEPKGADKDSDQPSRAPGTTSVALAAAGLLGVDRLRTRIGTWLGVDVPIRSSVAYAALSVNYEQAWRSDPNGIAESREGLGLGAGARLQGGERALALRGWGQLQVENLHASIEQPATGRRDAGSRVSFGLGAGADIILPLSAWVGVFAGARITWLGGDTAIHVQDKPVTVLPEWAFSLPLGLDLRLP